MAVLKVIEIMASSKKGWEDATGQYAITARPRIIIKGDLKNLGIFIRDKLPLNKNNWGMHMSHTLN